ncbi:MAG: hypothetical protein AMJ62_12100 [Myxococcales bacterium SG8_38]|nr:MAG: hypothetical protein AMJ62_12100 [Myxococcales bacterium SG8_38]
MARGAFARHAGLARLVRRALGAAHVRTAGAFAQGLDTASPSKKLGRLAGEHAGALEALAEERLAFGLADPELFLTTALGKLLLVVEEIRFIDGDSALAALGGTARFDDSARIAFFARAMRSGHFDPLTGRLRLLAPRNRDPQEPDCAE